MTLRFDHAVIAVRDLEAASQMYTRLGFRVESGGRHTGKGTRNALVRFPDNYLELLAVDDRAEALAAGASRRDLVRFLDEHGAGLSSFALRTSEPDELDRYAARWRNAGMDVAGPNPAERRRPDGTVLRWRTAVPGGSSVRQPWPFLIEWPDGALEGAPPPGSHPNGSLGVAEIAVGSNDVSVLDVFVGLGLDVSEADEIPSIGALRGSVDLDGSTMRILIPTGNGWVADRLAQRGSGPLELGIRVADLDAFAARLARVGQATKPAWPQGLRLSDPPPEASMLVFASAGDLTLS